jgi:hypothetical protein
VISEELMIRTRRVLAGGAAIAALLCGSTTLSAQTIANPLATAGQEVNAGVGHYNYAEPGDLPISIHGIKFSGEYTGTLSLDKRRHWFAQANVRGAIGSVTYDGWCSPYLLVPNSDSPNGYELDIGDASACSESGDKDWYLEGRFLVGKDFIGHSWALSPFSGVGLRHLSNGINGLSGYRTDNYLYLPLGATVRTAVASEHLLSFNVEYDHLLHGWQQTHDSALGGGDVPATATAPEFTIEGFTDISFDQSSGWAVRLSANIQVSRHWTVEPYYIRWSVGSSPVNTELVAFTVNNITAQETLGAYEPFNVTNEFGVKLGVRFK